MKKVEIQKSSSECRMCLDTAMMSDAQPLCHMCKKEIGEWIDTVTNFWDTYGIVQLTSGEIRKIPISMLKVVEG